MSDRGERYTDKKISQIDRQLSKTYRTAQKELEQKLKSFNQKFAAKDKQKRKDMHDGKISKQDYKDWLAGQVFMRSQFEDKIRQVQQVMLHHDKYAAQIINESRLDVFAENYYAEAFRANWIIQGVDWNIYNTQALERLIESDPQLLPEWKIDEKKDYTWNYNKVNNIVKQGIIQGESIDQITDRLCKDLCTQDENRMRLFARTAMTGAQNAGRQVQMQQAADMGIEVNKRWIATLDSRTRDSHRGLDGEEVPYDEDFSNGLEYPGDPSGAPEEVYNCRCTMQSVYPKYEDRSKKWREGAEIDGVPYEEWKEPRAFPNKYTTSFDVTSYPNTNVSQDVIDRVDETLDKVFSICPPLKKYLNEVIYSKEDGVASAKKDGKAIKLDKRAFSSIESLRRVLDEQKAKGTVVDTDDPMHIVAHEIGHCIETYVAAKRAHLDRSILRELQYSRIESEKSIMLQEYFLHMGFKENASEREIYDTIQQELGTRVIQDKKELAAQAFAQVMYGTKPVPHAQKLVDYLLKFTEE